MQNYQLEGLRRIVGVQNVLTDDGDTAGYTIDWRGRFKGRCLAVVRPANVEEVSKAVRFAAEHRISIVPQGGNTGLVGGGVPDRTGCEIVISLSRLNRIRKIDTINDTMVVDAGCVLANIQEAAAEVNRLFPLSLGSEGSCQIGGTIATNAGGLEVVRYGPMRDHVLGLEVVLPNGDIVSELRELRKNNTGYDVKQLFIGSEGTLGIITAASVRLYPRPHSVATAFCALDRAEDALRTLALVRQRCGNRLSTFEVMNRRQLELICTHTGAASPFSESHAWYLLVELSDPDRDARVDEGLLNVLSEGIEEGFVVDAAVAQSDSQRQAFWSLRHSVSESNVASGRVLSHDTSVPVSSCAEFVARVEEAIGNEPDLQLTFVGHLGDGNIHAVAIFAREMVTAENFEKRAEAVSSKVYQITADLGGSISAEHGVGVSLRDKLRKYKNPVELELMARIKRAIDPQNIMNPNRLLPIEVV